MPRKADQGDQLPARVLADHHYGEQVRALALHPNLSGLRQTLLDCQADEIVHRIEAAAAFGSSNPGLVLRTWCAMVGVGSRVAVALIRHI